MTLPDIRLTSEMLWWSALVTALIDVGLILLLVRRIPRARFNQLHWPVALAAGIFWVSYGLLLFALPEYVLYWASVLSLAVLLQRGQRWWGARRGLRTTGSRW